ncbi:MAG: hypothetical protein PHD82_11100, partial [Candidatus Riflebacteria bacterium]|nr:hypothetical protein [Candidatus Riflebacteria bacterium]
MESIVEQIAKEVMLKLKSDSANRGSSYTPPPRRSEKDEPFARNEARQSAILLTANFKVIDQVLSQMKAIAPECGRLIISSYLYENFGKDNIGRGFQLVH